MKIIGKKIKIISMSVGKECHYLDSVEGFYQPVFFNRITMEIDIDGNRCGINSHLTEPEKFDVLRGICENQETVSEITI